MKEEIVEIVIRDGKAFIDGTEPLKEISLFEAMSKYMIPVYNRVWMDLQAALDDYRANNEPLKLEIVYGTKS